MKRFITGILTLIAIVILLPNAYANDVCNPNNIDTSYKEIYCGIKLYDNEEADQDLIEILSAQFSINEELIKGILANTICETVNGKEYNEDKRAKLPQSIQDSCLSSNQSTGDVLGNWTIFTDIRNTYEKEKVIQLSSKSLEFKFKVSEQYWDGQIGPAPFDLIVDLNLIEIVLFGSKAQWMDDVFAFPAEEGLEEPDEVPADELLPEDGDGEDADKEDFEDTGDPGLTVTEDEGEIPPECVPPDDPDADIGDGPNSAYENKLCGNGTIDILMAEQCDDGNTKSGDGCNQYCQTEASGSNDQCIDPEAITFKRPENGADTVDGLTDGTGDTECPPGTVPKKGAGITGEEAGKPQEIEQSPEYPGPFLGGTLKQFPESTRPLCGPGQSPLQITAPTITEDEEGEAEALASKTYIATDDEGEAICLPFPICADLDDVRDFLFGENWRDDPVIKETAEAIESFFCVELTEHNRPLSPYQMAEGCIDCHITAMADALEKALATNVTPMKNTTSAFGISSAYGPAFSFNLSTATKAKVKYQTSNIARDATKKADQARDASVNDNTEEEPAIETEKNPLQAIKEKADSVEISREKIMEDTRIFKMSNEVISDQEVGSRVIPLLIQMRDSFSHIQSKYEGMISSTGFDEIEQCIK